MNHNLSKFFVPLVVSDEAEEKSIKLLREYLLGMNKILDEEAVQTINRNDGQLRNFSIRRKANYHLYRVKQKEKKLFLRFNLEGYLDFHMSRGDDGMGGFYGRRVFPEKNMVISLENFEAVLRSLGFVYMFDVTDAQLNLYREGLISNLGDGILVIGKDYPSLENELYAPALKKQLTCYGADEKLGKSRAKVIDFPGQKA